MQMMMQMLTPQQKQMCNNFTGLSNEEQAQRIADMCNKNGITKDQLAIYIKQLNK
jgi:hypothetical protein